MSGRQIPAKIAKAISNASVTLNYKSRAMNFRIPFHFHAPSFITAKSLLFTSIINFRTAFPNQKLFSPS